MFEKLKWQTAGNKICTLGYIATEFEGNIGVYFVRLSVWPSDCPSDCLSICYISCPHYTLLMNWWITI